MEAYYPNLSLLLSLASIAVAAACLWWTHMKKFTFWSERGVPGPRPLPLFGNSLSMMFGSTVKVDMANRLKYGRVYGTYEGTAPVLLIHDPQVVQEIYQTHFASMSNRLTIESTGGDPFKANSHVYANGEQWKNLRYAVSRSMANSSIREMTGRMDTEQFMPILRSQVGQRIRLTQIFRPFCLNVAAATMFGIDFDLFNSKQKEQIIDATDKVVTAGSPFSQLPYTRFWLSERLPVWFSKMIHLIPDDTAAKAFYVKLIKDLLARRQANQDDSKQKDVATTFDDALQAGTVTEYQVISSSVLLLGGVAGSTHDIICSLLYVLAMHPEHQKLVQQEIDEHASSDLSYETLSKITYLHAVIFETLRLYPVEARGWRHVSVKQGITIPGTSIQLPYGTAVNIPIHAIQRDPELWTDPETFDPKRFLPENKDQVVNCAFISFGAGPRMCPGIKASQFLLKRAIVPILREFNVLDASPDELEFPCNSRKGSDATKQISVRLERRVMDR